MTSRKVGEPAEFPMIRTCVPGPPLSDFVESFWLHEGFQAPHPRERVLPTGTIGLIFDLGPRPTVGPLISGARSGSFLIETGRATSVLGVDFAPGGASPFLGVPAGELQDILAPLDALWGVEAVGLQERLAESRTAVAKFRLLERALLGRVTGRPGRNPAVSIALKDFGRRSGGRSVGDMARRLGLSPKQFLRTFRDEVGLPPKLFLRVRRFQDVLAIVGGRPRVDWAAVALSCGYADQAHLIREFRAFSGLTPTAYLAARGTNPNHVPVRP